MKRHASGGKSAIKTIFMDKKNRKSFHFHPGREIFLSAFLNRSSVLIVSLLPSI